MKFILRVAGTWLLGLSLILVVIDGTKTLATGALTITSLAETWRGFHIDSWEPAQQAILDLVAPISGETYAKYFLEWPSWAILGVFGILLLLAGRRRAGKSYIETN